MRTNPTNKKTPELAKRYLAALRAHLGTRRSGSAVVARRLGRAATTSGFNAVDLARMHEQSMAALALSLNVAHTRHDLIRRAGRFLAEALVPMEKLHRTTHAAFLQLQRRAAILHEHRAALTKGNRQLAREVRRRQAGEEAVRKGKAHYHQLLVESQAMQKKLRHMARQILSAQEDERRAISRELHDEVAQTLMAINVELATLGHAGSLNARALAANIARTQRLVEKSMNAVHQFARELRPVLLDDLGLIAALQTYMERLAARKKLMIRLTAFAGIEALDSARRTVLYRVAQEALTNVARHARATTVNMIIREIPGAIRMEVNDDGKSFQVLKTLSARSNKRLGLLGMRERLEMVGGTLMIESAPGQGTSVRAEIPFGPEDGA